MGKTVLVDLDDLTALLTAAIGRALKNGGVYERAGMIGPDAVIRVSAGLAAGGHILGGLSVDDVLEAL